MSDVDAVLFPEARDVYEQQSVTDQAEIDAVILRICADPATDDVVTFKFEQLPFYSAFLYNDGRWWCVYQFMNNWTIEIWNIGRQY